MAPSDLQMVKNRASGIAGDTVSPDGELRHLPVELIQRGRYQPRSEISSIELEELAESIRSQGLVQPVVVRPIGCNRYELIAGERRWRASQIAGLHEVPAVVRDVGDETALTMALIENVQRENLNPVEQARAIRRLIDEFGLTQREVAECIGRSRSAVAHLLRILSLTPEVLGMVAGGRLELGHAKLLVGLQEAAQRTLAELTVWKGLSVRALERKVAAQFRRSDKHAKARDPDVVRLEQNLSNHVGARTTIQYRAENGTGHIAFSFHSLDELDGIIARLGYPIEET